MAQEHTPALPRAARAKLDAKGRVVEVDGAMERLLDRPDLVGATLLELTDPDDAVIDEAWLARIGSAEVATDAYATHKHLVRCDGSRVFVHQIAWASRDERGRVQRIDVQVEAAQEQEEDEDDSTSALRAREALERSEASFRSLLEATPDFIVVHREGVIAYANPAVTRALGWESSDKLVGTRAVDLFHDDDRPTIESRVLVPAANVPVCVGHETFPLRWKHKDQSWRCTEAVAAPVDFEGAHAVIVVARDVTERAELQQRLLQHDRMAALGTLAAGVAHEINNPLTYLLVNLEHVLRRLRAASASDDPVGELTAGGVNGGIAGLVKSLQHAQQGANRVRQIVRDLLTFSQGNVEQRGLADVRGVLESAVQMAWHEIRHRARLTKSFADVPPVEANEARLGQVFLNLLVNAAQAIPEGQADKHEVRVMTRTDERGNAVVEVTDTGVGIDPQHLPRVFDPFFTTKGEGTGLGLSISHGTVRGLGGEIQVTSTPGRGATFRVVLPPAHLWRPPSPALSPEARAVPRRRVLIIDDEKLVGEAIARSLAEENDVQVVSDAQQALARIETGERYDLVLVDLMMPVMTGMDFYAEIVRTAPKLAGKIVFMTGGAFTPRARAFLESASNECLEKPIDMSKLRSIIARSGG